MLRDGGHLLLLEYNEKGGSSIDVEGHKLKALDPELGRDTLPALDHVASQLLAAEGFRGKCRISLTPLSKVKSAFVAMKDPERSHTSASRTVHVLHFLPISEAGTQIIDGLKRCDWNVSMHSHPFRNLEFDGIILILDDLTSPFLSTISQEHWTMLQDLINSHNKILWLTEGSQFQVTKPENAQIHGLMRTLRDEDPSINLTTLDVEDAFGKCTISTINSVLEFLRNSTFEKTGDYEFVERCGKINISRVLPDYAMNSFAKAQREGAELTTRSFHDPTSQIRLMCERVGNLDSLKFNKVSPLETHLRQNEVEIEIFVAGLNFKDIAISTGLIPGNERLLGFEGAGVIRRSKSDLYHVGQRVLFAKAGSFANRVITEVDLVHSIPDSMSFEEAATLGAVYPVAMYSLFDLATTRRGQRVLIHSAAGGLGIACIQLCQFLGADIYATVGNDEKREFLINTFGISSTRIFSSRSTLFATELMEATKGEGVYVIINSLTGDLLEESWGCIRDGGTMIELGKRDIIERNYLPMEPFSRNVSYRSFDISHKSVSNSIISR